MKRILVVEVELDWDYDGFKDQSAESLFRDFKEYCIDVVDDVKFKLIREEKSDPGPDLIDGWR